MHAQPPPAVLAGAFEVIARPSAARAAYIKGTVIELDPAGPPATLTCRIFTWFLHAP